MKKLIPLIVLTQIFLICMTCTETTEK